MNFHVSYYKTITSGKNVTRNRKNWSTSHTTLELENSGGTKWDTFLFWGMKDTTHDERGHTKEEKIEREKGKRGEERAVDSFQVLSIIVRYVTVNFLWKWWITCQLNVQMNFDERERGAGRRRRRRGWWQEEETRPLVFHSREMWKQKQEQSSCFIMGCGWS